MKATIVKSIGNTYLIEANGGFFDLVFFKTARNKVNKTNILNEFNELLKEPFDIEVNQKIFDEEKINDTKSEVINWTDKRRTLGEIIDMGVEKRIIKICKYKFIRDSKKQGFEQAENPRVEYFIVVNGLEVKIKKDLFNYLGGAVEIIEERAI